MSFGILNTEGNGIRLFTGTIALAQAADGNVLSLARVNGSTNPSLTWSLVDSGNHVKAALNSGNIAIDLSPSAYAFGNNTDNPTYSFLGSGQTTIGSTQINLSGNIQSTQTIAGSTSANFQNSGTGTAASSTLALQNSTNSLIGAMTGTGYTGTLLTGGPTGQGGFLYTNAASPLTLGVNSKSVLSFVSATYTFGNTTDNPAYLFVGSGAANFGSPQTGNARVNISAAANSGLSIQSTGNATDQKIWDGYADGTTLHLRAVNDTYSTANSWADISRSGASISNVNFPNGTVQIADQASNLWVAGYRDTPLNAQGAGYTLVLADRGKMIQAGGGATPITIPANGSVAFPVGSIIGIVNISGGNITIQITTDTLTWPAGAGATGTRTLANNSYAIIWKVASTSWWIAGVNLS